MNIKSVALIALLLILTTSNQNPQSQQMAGDIVSMEGPVLAEQAKLAQQRDEQMPSFIREEIKQYGNNWETFKQTESFIITILPQQKFEFRYKIQSNPNPSIMARIFTQESEDDLTPIKDHDEDDYLDIQTSITLFGSFASVGKAYLGKFLHLGYHNGPELFVRLQSKFQREVIVQISLSGPPVKLDRFSNVVKNSQFSITANKLKAIEDEMKEIESSNRHQFKFQWGFLQREEHYEQEMLKLTGVEAIVILATAIVQMYCIKSLFDKNGVI